MAPTTIFRHISAVLHILLPFIPKVTAVPRPTPQDTAAAQNTLQWTVLGDSWASGVAYNKTNVFGDSDLETCFRIKEAWGVQMSEDKSWVSGDQKFNFAACGGSLMKDVKGQFEQQKEVSTIVWAMFGGNDALFGRIARACIYQPIDLSHPGGWGEPWDRDPEGKGECRKSIKAAHETLDRPEIIRAETKRTIDEIFRTASAGGFAKPTFDLYLSAYVKFFNAETDGCNDWTFAHPSVSTGKPRVVKGLRKEMNDLVDKFNRIQAEVVGSYSHPPFINPETHRLHHETPSDMFEGHRFCESGHTFEDQFYNPDVWLWNLQYSDESSTNDGLTRIGDVDHKWEAIANATSGMLEMITPNPPPPGEKFDFPGLAKLPPILAVQDEDYTVGALQRGFGWTARPFHPKFTGHKVLKDYFIQRMRRDGIPGVRPLDEGGEKIKHPRPLLPN